MKISVVIINFNYAKYLKKAIDSVLDQDYHDVQLIIVDDASTDTSREIIAEYEDRILPVYHPVNRGHGAGFNSGYSVSEGQLVKFLDADDFLLPGALKAIAEWYQPDIAQYQYLMQLVDGQGVPYDVFPAYGPMDAGDLSAQLRRTGAYRTTLTSGLVFSRSALDAVMPMDPERFRQGGDGYLTAVVPLYGRVASIDAFVAAYRQHGDNHSSFAYDVARRARWSVLHNEERYRALREHAARLGLEVDEAIGRGDADILMHKLALAVLDPNGHPTGHETRQRIAWTAVRYASPNGGAILALIQKVWWLAVGFLPLFIALPMCLWKMDARTRPAFVQSIASLLRKWFTRSQPVPTDDTKA